MRRLFLLSALIFCAMNVYAREDNLYEKFKGYREIKVLLEDIVNEAKEPDVKADTFKKVFEEALCNRKGIKFICVGSKDAADVVIRAHIKNYMFTEKAMPMIFSSATLVGDALSPKSSGKLVVDYEVRGKDDKTLAYYKNFTTEERRPQDHMKGEPGFVHSVEKSANRFIHKAFYKSKDN